MNEVLLEALKGALLGGVIGYATNRLAVWMLFRPRNRWRLFGIPVPLTPGLVVANRDRLADSIGDTVGKELLSPEIVAAHLREANLQATFRRLLDEKRDALARSHATLLEVAGEDFRPFLEDLQNAVAEALTRRVGSAVGDVLREGEALNTILAAVPPEWRRRPLGEWLGGEDRADLERFLDSAIHRIFDSEEFRRVAAKALDAGLRQLAEDAAAGPLRDSLAEELHKRAAAAVPVLQEGLAEYLGGDHFAELARDRLASRVQQLVRERFPRLGLFIREKMLRQLIAQQWPAISSELQEIARGEQMAGFLTGKLDSMAEDLANSLLALPASQQFRARVIPELTSSLVRSLKSGGAGDPGSAIARELLQPSPQEWSQRFEAWLAENGEYLAAHWEAWWNAGGGKKLVRGTVVEAIGRLVLHQRLGRVMAIVEGDAWEQFADGAARTAEERLLRSVPAILQDHVNLSGIVSSQIHSLDPAEVEAAILRVSRRELNGIVRLGGLIGLCVGATAGVLNWLIQG